MYRHCFDLDADVNGSSASSDGGSVPTPTPGTGCGTSRRSSSAPRSSASPSRPRPSQSSAGTFPTLSSLTKEDPRKYTDNDNARVREEEEWFRARGVAASTVASASEPAIKASMSEAFARYEEKWSSLGSLSVIHFGDIPWAVFTSALIAPNSPYSTLSKNWSGQKPLPRSLSV